MQNLDQLVSSALKTSLYNVLKAMLNPNDSNTKKGSYIAYIFLSVRFELKVKAL